MNHILTIGIIGIATGALFAGESSPKDKAANATKQLGGKANYSWVTANKEAW